ncbi:NUDIX hydrolase [Methylobacterium sp. J-078]|uniref:NUDIX hydrolase n=1 Tax=Methylobacterium sp. J-078 TaxID=2836657 RepID=UPI001FBA2540|nr:NUDIX hydrolase [Methylobacterium sp. J-078]MCJ2046688.1 NUDIX hydrolase [Methylobacterium sp. J-078]
MACGGRPCGGPEDTKLKKRTPRPQIAALPFRLDADGRPEILLVTSRETKRWIIPKGWPMRGRKDHRAAEQEAFEEAGLKGRIGKKAIGRYRYDKRLADGSALACAVTVYPLRVIEERKRWPEHKQRRRCWYPAEDAAALVQECDLQELLLAFRGPADRAAR